MTPPGSPRRDTVAAVAPIGTPGAVGGVVATAALAIAVLASAATLGGCATATPATGADGEPLELEPVDAERARVGTDVKAALLRAGDVDAAAIGVRLDGETVRLDGFVGSEAERERALAVAREAVPGREVVSEIEVR